MKRRHFHVTVGTRPQVGSTIIHCEMKSMLISLSSSSPLLLIFTDMHTDSVFPLKQWTICVLVCCASLLKTEEKARLTSEAGSQPTAADCEASVSGIRVTVERFEAKDAHSHPAEHTLCKSCANERLFDRTTRCGRPLWTRAGCLYTRLWQALSLKVCPSIISHPFFLISQHERKLSTHIFSLSLSFCPPHPLFSRLLSFRISDGRSLGSSLIVWVSREEIGRV